jgi:6-phosphogluconolactonase (cycloisomerase 2 family)
MPASFTSGAAAHSAAGSSSRATAVTRSWWRSLLVLGFGALLVDCGGGGGGGPPCTNCVPSSSDFVYEAIANQVLIFEVDSSSGTVQATLTPVSSAQIPGGILATSNHFVYVTEAAGAGGVVYAFAVNTSTGELTPVMGSPFSTGVAQPALGMAVDPAGKFLYIAEQNTNQVAAFTIAADGTLTPIAGSPFETGDTHPVAASVDPSGKYLFVSNQDSTQGAVSAFSINGSTGALTAVNGSPFATLPNGGPALLATDPTAQFLYVPLATGASLFGFEIGSTGALTPIAGSPFGVGSQPVSVTIAPSGTLLFSADFAGNDVSVMSIDATTGALSAVSGSPVSVQGNPFQVTTNASGTLLFVNCSTELGILTFTVSSAGALTPVAPLDGGATSGGIVVVRKGS